MILKHTHTQRFQESHNSGWVFNIERCGFFYLGQKVWQCVISSVCNLHTWSLTFRIFTIKLFSSRELYSSLCSPMERSLLKSDFSPSSNFATYFHTLPVCIQLEAWPILLDEFSCVKFMLTEKGSTTEFRDTFEIGTTSTKKCSVKAAWKLV